MRSVRFPSTPPRSKPAQINHPREVMRAAYLTIVAITATARSEKTRVNPLAKLNAAPEFFSNVNCKKVPITGCGSDEKLESAHVLVA